MNKTEEMGLQKIRVPS